MKHIGANSQYLYTVPNLSGGTVLSYNTTTKQVTHRTYAEIIGDMNLVTTNTSQNISGQKTFEKIIVSTSPDSIAGNLGTLGTNYKLALTNDGNYGTAFWVQGNGHGYIQQQRFDNNPIAYRLNLQPLGGELYYGVNEVATVNQLSNFVTLQTPQSIIATKTFTDSLVIQGNSTDNRTTKLIFKNSSDPTNTDWAISHGLYGYSNVGFSIGKWNNNVFEHGLYINELFTIFSHNHGNSSQWYEAHTWGNHALAGYLTDSLGDSRYVTLNTSQNILSSKTFNARTTFKGGTGNDYHLATIEVQGNGSTVLPGIGFHQPGVYAASLLCSSGTMFEFRAYASANYASVKALSFVKSGGTATQILMADGSVINKSEFVNTPDGYSVNINGADLNVLTTTGFYRGVGLINAPNAGWFYVTVESHDSGAWCKQTVTSYGSDNSPNETYQRVRLAGAWQPWRRILNDLSLTGYATETWINTNFIPKSHPVYNVTQGQITGWESSHKVDGTTLINNGSNGRHNKTWFDHSWAGTGKLGSVLNFAGFDGYNAEMFIQYSAGNELGFRTRNGDTGVWNPVRWGWHSGNLQGYREIEIDTGLIRLKPLKVNFGAGNHSFSDPSRLIRVICSGTTGIDITELFPHQEYVIYNTGNIPTIILVGGVKKFGIETRAFRRFYVTEDLKMLVEPMEVLEVM